MWIKKSVSRVWLGLQSAATNQSLLTATQQPKRLLSSNNEQQQQQQPSNNTQQLNEDDWFKKILKPEPKTVVSAASPRRGVDLEAATKIDLFVPRVKRFGEMNADEKREYIVSFYEASKERGDVVPKCLTDEYMNVLMRSESYHHFKKTLE